MSSANRWIPRSIFCITSVCSRAVVICESVFKTEVAILAWGATLSAFWSVEEGVNILDTDGDELRLTNGVKHFVHRLEGSACIHLRTDRGQLRKRTVHAMLLL